MIFLRNSLFDDLSLHLLDLLGQGLVDVLAACTLVAWKDIFSHADRKPGFYRAFHDGIDATTLVVCMQSNVNNRFSGLLFELTRQEYTCKVRCRCVAGGLVPAEFLEVGGACCRKYLVAIGSVLDELRLNALVTCPDNEARHPAA